MWAALKRRPDEIIGDDENPYLLRWWLFRCRSFNIYLHRFLRDDDDRALHDHPWPSLSFASGEYLEMIGNPNDVKTPKIVLRRKRFFPVFRRATHTHRIVLFKNRYNRPIPIWTLFLTGKRVREWYFHCPKGLRHWRDFCDERDHGKVGKGCGD